MKTNQVFLGIGVSKDSFDIAFIDENEKLLHHQKIEMTREGFKQLDESLSNYEKEETLICVESTGIYHINLLLHLLENDYTVYAVNPILIKQFMKSLSLRKTKTDKKDAFTISTFIKRSYHGLHNTSVEDLYNLKPLIREREYLVKNVSKIKTQIKTVLKQLFPELENNINVFTKTMLSLLLKAPSPEILSKMKEKDISKLLNVTGRKIKISAKELKKLAKNSIGKKGDKTLEKLLIMKIQNLNFIQKQIEELDKVIDENIDDNEDLKSKIDIISSIDGIGEDSAKRFMLEVGDISRFENSKKLRAYIGTDPEIKQSGISVDNRGKIVKKGNSHLRHILYNMGVGVIKYCDVFKNYFHKKRSEGMSYTKSVIAVANKLLGILYSMLMNETKFSEDRYSKTACSRQ